MDCELRKEIVLLDEDIKQHSKASEKYIHVQFRYGETLKDIWIPIEYRRTGVFIKNEQELYGHLNSVYDQLNPAQYEHWLKTQENFWANEKPNAKITKAFFDSLADGEWKCVGCQLPPNPNWARRVQDLKEFGYTIATDISRYCPNCKENKTHLMLLPIDRIGVLGNGYETLSKTLRKRIIKILGSIDAYEGTVSSHVLPDHKFSEILWDDKTKADNLDTMTDDEIKAKFQLLTNQRNQQKREVCRTCFQTGRRGTIFGIPYYYVGCELWDKEIPRKGKDAEKGCIGCPWYDIQAWREHLIVALKQSLQH